MEESEQIPGVVYLSTIPKGLNVALISDIMRNFGQVGRVYLVPKKNFGKRRQYEEGWVEFLNYKKAKRAASMLNSNEVTGSKVIILYCFVFINLDKFEF